MKIARRSLDPEAEPKAEADENKYKVERSREWNSFLFRVRIGFLFIVFFLFLAVDEQRTEAVCLMRMCSFVVFRSISGQRSMGARCGCRSNRLHLIGSLHARTLRCRRTISSRSRTDDFCSIFHRFDVNACERISITFGFSFAARNARIIFVNWNLCSTRSVPPNDKNTKYRCVAVQHAVNAEKSANMTSNLAQ